jgi:hypothetical protein
MTEMRTNHVPTFEPGDTIGIVLQVEDDSGVARVDVRFRVTDGASVQSVSRSVELEGQQHAEVDIKIEVDDAMPSGRYECEYVALTDTRGNKSLFAAPGIEFRVEGTAADHEGPALAGWRWAEA